MIEIKDTARGLVGYLHELKIEKDSVLVFQLPRQTNMINRDYLSSAKSAVQELLDSGNKVLFIGADVNVYSIAGEEATMLVLKGII